MTFSSYPTSSHSPSSSYAVQLHQYVKQLNNSAALCIEVGHYKRAISSLQKALRMSLAQQEQQQQQSVNVNVDDDDERMLTTAAAAEVCMCYQCTLDGCIAFSENNLPTIKNSMSIVSSSSSSSTSTSTSTSITSRNDSNNDNHNKYKNKNKRKRKAVSQAQAPHICVLDDEGNTNDHTRCCNSNSNSKTDEENKSKATNKEYSCCCGLYGFIYKRPIRVCCSGEAGQHDMGSTLFVVIIFNLAIAHHLYVINYNCDCADNSTSMTSTDTTTTTTTTSSASASKAIAIATSREKVINKTLQLYELAFNWQSKLFHQEQQESTTTTSTTSNIRFNMIIHNNLSQIYRLVNNPTKHRQSLNHLLSAVMIVIEYKTRNDDENNNNNASNNNNMYGSYPRCMDLEGFLQNTAPLILQEKDCARAA